MLRDAINEIRLHPGRFVATLLAVAISVGFISAIMIGVRTEENSMTRSGAIAVSKSDVVVEQVSANEQIKPDEVLKAIQGASGVTQAETSMVALFPLTHENFSVYSNAIVLPSAEFRWASLAEGSWPSKEEEITLSKAGAEKLHVKVGDKVTMGFSKDERSGSYRVVGITNDAPSLYSTNSYVTGLGPDRQASMWVVKAQDKAAAIASIKRALEPFGSDNFKVRTADDYRNDQMKQLTGGFDVFRNLLLGFAAISAVVGTIIIANTFTILITQRRRQIGLLRAVGASTGQVAGRLFAEAVLLGLVGSLIGVGIGAGVAAVAGIWTGAIYWGLVFPLGELGIAVLAGVLITVFSMIGPSLAATRVSPLEALQVVPSAARVKRLSITRGVFCCLFLLLGGGLVFQAFVNPAIGLLWAIGGGGFLSLAILLAAPFYVPVLLRLFGWLLGFMGSTVKLATSNSVRNPRRASATAVALMLAVGLVVTLQVAVSTMRTSALSEINQRYPVDVSVRDYDGPLKSGVVEELRRNDGVAKVVEISSKQVELGRRKFSVRNVNAARAELGLPDRMNAPDGVILVSPETAEGLPDRVDLPGAGQVEVRSSKSVRYDAAAVSESTFEKLPGQSEIREAWVKLTDRTSSTALNQVMKVISPLSSEVDIGGGATMAGMLEQIVNVLLMVLTALLGVAVVIALVGVGNTLGLSVIERQRESALLRALGMQRRSLRLMLLAEAMLLAVVGIVMGVAAGSFFGWLGVVTSLGMLDETSRPQAVFSVDMLYTGGLILVCVVAAALASVLPGRRAANATPTEALAAE